jgi:hypothetical protein
VFASRARSGPIPLRLRTFGGGSTLRSQGSSEDSTIALRAGFFGVRFQSSQRTRSRCRLGVHHEGCRAWLVRGCGLWVCARVGSAGSVLRSQGSSEGSAFALRAGFFWCSLPKLATDRSRSAYVLFVEDRSSARRERGDRWSFRAGARGGLRVLTFQCSLRPGPACAFWGGQATCYKTGVDFDLQNVGPVRRRLSSELVDFACGSRVEDSVFRQYARTGMTPHDAICECGVNDRRYAKISDRKLMTPT